MPSIIHQQTSKTLLAPRFGIGRGKGGGLGKWLKITLLATAIMWVGGVNAVCRGNQGIALTTPNSVLTDHGNGTVTDTRTGLMWMQCSEGQDASNNCAGNASTYTWKAALELASQKTFANFSDWRLPNINELDSIVEIACYTPSINLSRFPNTPSATFWSSSAAANEGQSALYVSFSDSHSHYGHRNGSWSVRLVRGGQ